MGFSMYGKEKEVHIRTYVALTYMSPDLIKSLSIGETAAHDNMNTIFYILCLFYGKRAKRN